MDEETRKRLSSLGYLRGYKEAGEIEGVVYHNPEESFDGYNLYVSGHAPEATLIDMEGNVLHRWRKEFLDIWPRWKHYRPTESEQTPPHYFFRSHVFPNGDLLAVFEGYGLVKLDKDSNIVWRYEGSEAGGAVGCHHDFWIDADDSIAVLTYTRGRIVKSINKNTPIWEDYIAILDPDGRERDRFSLIECFLNSDYAPLLEDLIGEEDHVLHTNSIQVLDGSLEQRSHHYRRGNILVGCRENDVVAIVDPRLRKVVWAMKGLWMGQHSARLLPGGTMLVFDNKGSDPIYGRSLVGTTRILEFDPFSQGIVWEYPGESGPPFFCPIMGTVEQVANANRIVTDSVSGRAFEVTLGKEIVWEWVSPHRAGENNELIATLCQMTRIPKSFPLDWLQRDASSPAARKATRRVSGL